MSDQPDQVAEPISPISELEPAPPVSGRGHASPDLSTAPRISFSVFVRATGMTGEQIPKGFAQWVKSKQYRTKTMREWYAELDVYSSQKV